MLKIKNFQSHKDSTLDLKSPGINIVRGLPQTGKSSVIRALEALANNGVMDRTHDSKETRVEWQGCARVRSNTTNQYEVEDRVYKAMRTEIPKEVLDRLRLGPVNFRGQHQTYFLLNDSPGAVAREMNKLTDLEVIDYVVGRLKGELKDADDSVKTIKVQAAQKEAAARALDWAEAADADLQGVESLEAKIESMREAGCMLQNTLESLAWLDDSLAAFPPLDTGWINQALAAISDADIQVLGKLAVYLTNHEQWLNSLPVPLNEAHASVSARLSGLPDMGPLRALLESLEEYNQDLASCPDVAADLVTLAGIEIHDAGPLRRLIEELEGLRDFSGMEGWEDRVEDLRVSWEAAYDRKARADALNKLLNTMAEIGVSFTEAEIEYENQLQAFNDKLKEAGQCPFCSRRTDV